MLTAIVLAKNEAANLTRCLPSLSFCDSILVVDDSSIDNTVKIAQKFSARLLTHALGCDFSAQRNWAANQVKSSWLLYVDADEQVPPALAEEIIAAIRHPNVHSYFIPRLDFMWGRQLRYGDLKGVSFLRLVRRGSGKWIGSVHETWKTEMRTGKLRHPLYHYPHPDMAEFLKHINYFSTLKARQMHAQGKRANVVHLFVVPVWRFFKNYVLKLGFLDHTPGFIHAMTMSFYAFLVAGKLILLSKNIPPND